MTNFTRVNIDPERRNAWRVLSSPERLHAAVARATSPDDDGRTPRDGSMVSPRTLWRIDSSRRSRFMKLYISSAQIPDSDILCNEFGVSSKDISTCDYEPFLERLRVGQEWGFRLRANPTQTQFVKGHNQRGRVAAIVDEKSQIDWLLKQSQKHGFHLSTDRIGLPEVRIRSAQKLCFKRKNREVTLNEVDFDGILAIDTLDLMRTTMLQGIGRAKGYGFGMLTVVPLMGRTYGDETV